MKRKEKNEKKHFYRRFIPIVLGPGDVNIIMSDVLSVQSWKYVIIIIIIYQFITISTNTQNYI